MFADQTFHDHYILCICCSIHAEVDSERLLQAIQELSVQIELLKQDQQDKDGKIAEKLALIDDTIGQLDGRMSKLIDSQDNEGAFGGGSTGSRRRGGSGDSSCFYTPSDNMTGSRATWNSDDPMLISEGLFAIAKVLSFLRPISLTVMNRHVGPMQISLGGMMFDIAKFMLIFCFVLFAFSLGMNQLYGYYASEMMAQCPACKMYFSS